MKLWRCERGLLMERPASAGVPDSLIALSRRDWVDPPADYWLVDARGEVIERFFTAVWSIDDELGGTLYAIEEGCLKTLVVRDIWQGEDTFEERVAIAGLKPAEDEAGKEWARLAISRDQERAVGRRRQGESRVGAIAGAEDDYRAGEEFRAAQRVLRDRVARFGESLCEDLLRVLVRFGAFYRGRVRNFV